MTREPEIPRNGRNSERGLWHPEKTSPLESTSVVLQTMLDAWTRPRPTFGKIPLKLTPEGASPIALNLSYNQCPTLSNFALHTGPATPIW